MGTFVSNRDGGKTNEEGHYRFHVRAWNGNIENGLQVTQNSPLGMSVLVDAGDLKIDYSGYGYTAWSDASATVTISTASPSNPRIDRIVAYIDRGETPQTVNPNNPGMLKFMAVAGTPAGSPARPNDSAVNSAVGASNPWCDLADVSVGTGVTQITNANITDTRTFITPQIALGSLVTADYANGSVTPVKRSGGFKVGVIPGATFGSTGNKAITGVGFTPKMVVFRTLGPNTTTAANIGYGATDGTSQYFVCSYVTNAPNAGRYTGTDACIAALTSASTLAVKASIVSLDADGFTINVSITTALDVAYEAYA